MTTRVEKYTRKSLQFLPISKLSRGFYTIVDLVEDQNLGLLFYVALASKFSAMSMASIFLLLMQHFLMSAQSDSITQAMITLARCAKLLQPSVPFILIIAVSRSVCKTSISICLRSPFP